MFNTFLPQIHVLKTLNFAFRKSLICNILQITCQIHLLATNISQNPIILQQVCPKEWRYTNKTTQLLVQNKRGRSTTTQQDSASCKQQRKLRKKPSESVNASQLHVDRHKMGSIHPVDGKPSQPSSIVHTMTGISKYLDLTVLGNHEESSKVNKISTKPHTFWRIL